MITVPLSVSGLIEDDSSPNEEDLSDPPLNGSKDAQSAFSKWNDGYVFNGEATTIPSGVFQNNTQVNPGAGGVVRTHTLAFKVDDAQTTSVLWAYSDPIAIFLRVTNGLLQIAGSGPVVTIDSIQAGVEYGVAVIHTQGGGYEGWIYNSTNDTVYKPLDGGSCCDSATGTLTIGGRMDNAGNLEVGCNCSIYEYRLWNGRFAVAAQSVINATNLTYDKTLEGNELRAYFMEETTDTPLNSATFDNVGEVRVDNSFLDPKIWVNDHHDVSQNDPMSLHRYDENLTNEINTLPCADHSQMTSGNPTSLFGMGITVDQRPIFSCSRPGGSQVLVLGDVLGNVDTWIQNDCRKADEIIEPRTGNAIWGIKKDFTCYDFNDMLLPRTLRFDKDVNDIAISPGEENWGAMTGPDGTDVRKNGTGSKVIPTQAIQGDSIAIYDNRVWIAFSSSDTVTRYDLLEGNTLSINVSASIDTDDIHSIRLSRDGNYLMVRNDAGVELYGANNLTQIKSIATADVVSMDMDPLNNYLYVATNTNVDQFEVFNVTFSTAGGGNETNANGRNPPPSSEPFQGEETTDPFAEEEPSAGLDEGPVSNDAFNLTNAASSMFGGNETAAALFFAAILIFAFTMLGIGATSQFTQNNSAYATGGSVGALGGFFMAVALGWVPGWLIFMIVVLAATVLSWKIFGGD